MTDIPEGYEENTTDRGTPPLENNWKQRAIERGETDWPQLPIEDDTDLPNTTHYQVLKGRVFDPDDELGSRTWGWPPRHDQWGEYPLDWFEYTELDNLGRVTDSSGKRYPVFTGNLEPIEGRCNAPVGKWRDRYPEIRFCGRAPNANDEHGFCNTHRGRLTEDDATHILDNMDAEEMVQTGFFATTVDHAYEGIEPVNRVFAWGLFASLMGESTKEFAPEKHTRTIDFADTEYVPDEADDDGIVEVAVKYPTQELDPALALFNAAVDAVKMLNVQPRLLDADNGGVMSTEETTNAQLTAPPSEHDPSPQEWKTIEQTKEHPLNLPYKRLISGREDLLKRGGIVVDPTEDESVVDDSVQIVTDVAADPENPDKDPKYGDNETAVTKDIAANVDDESL